MSVRKLLKFILNGGCLKFNLHHHGQTLELHLLPNYTDLTTFEQFNFLLAT